MNPTSVITPEHRLKLILNIVNQIYIIKLNCAERKIEHIPFWLNQVSILNLDVDTT